MTLVTRQSMTDDDGTFTTGTVGDKAFFDALYDEIDAQCHSTTNTTVTPKAIIDEVVTARGSLGNLDARLDVALNEDGTLKTQAGLLTVAQAGTLTGRNLVPNSDFLLWARGDSSAPDYWTLSGTGAAIARTGTGLADTTRPGSYGDFACKITFGSTAAKLTQKLLSTAAFTRADGFKGRTVAVGCWVQASTASIARVVIDDGVTTTATSFHTGGGTPEWLTATHAISGSATKLDVYLEVAASGSAYFQDVLVLISDVVPADFIPCEMQKGVIHFAQVGTVSASTKKGVFSPGAPGIVTDVQLRAETAPTGQALIVDVNTWDGAAFTSMFSTLPQIAASANQGGAAPDSTYARRCFRPLFGDTLAAGNLLSYDVDQVGSGTAGADLIVEARVRQYIRALEAFADYNDTGE